MSNDEMVEVFADGIVNVSHANGVFRIIFGQQEVEGAVKKSLKLMVPASQITPIIKALTNAVVDIDQKLGSTAKAVAPKKAPKPRAKKLKKPN